MTNAPTDASEYSKRNAPYALKSMQYMADAENDCRISVRGGVPIGLYELHHPADGQLL